MQIRDQLNRLIVSNETPKRIVSLVPSQTELLVDIGLEDQIVGVTKFCVHPNHLRKTKTIVGGTKLIDIEKIKALKPDIILCNKEENTKNIIKACERICNVHISDIFNLNDCLEMMGHYGTIFNIEHEVSSLISEIEIEHESFKIYISQTSHLKVAYFIWKTPWMVAAKNTFINHLLEVNNFENVYADLERYPEVDITTLKSLSPDVIFLSSEPFPFNTSHIKELEYELPKTKIVLVDGELFSWYGSRLKKAFNYFKDLRQNL